MAAESVAIQSLYTDEMSPDLGPAGPSGPSASDMAFVPETRESLIRRTDHWAQLPHGVLLTIDCFVLLVLRGRRNPEQVPEAPLTCFGRHHVDQLERRILPRNGSSREAVDPHIKTVMGSVNAVG